MESEPPDLEPVIEARLVDDLQSPQWLHPSSILFELLSTLRQFVIAALLALFMASSGNRYALFIAAAGVALTAARALLRFLTLRYQLRGGELRISDGLLFRRHRTVPAARIQNIDLLQNPLHHAFGVAEVRVETAGGSEPEAKLRVLSLADVARLRAAIFRTAPESTRQAWANSAAPGGTPESLAGAAASSTAESPSAATQSAATREGFRAAAETPQWSYRIGSRRLILAGLLSNRGLLLIPLLFGLFFQFDLERQIDVRQAREWLPRGLSTAETAAVATSAAIAVLLLLRLASVLWFLFRFHGYTLQRYGEDLRISCGLFTRVSATVPRHRIQFISVQQTLLGRLFSMATIRIETASGGGTKEEDAAETVARRWFVPVLKFTEAEQILPELREGLVFQPAATSWQSTSTRASRRLGRLAVIRALVVAAVGLAVSWPWGGLAGLVALPPLLLYAVRYAGSLQYARSDQGVMFRSGMVSRKTSLTFFDKVQTVAVLQSPFDRRWEMATLQVDTAAAGPAQHRIEMDYLPATVAFAEAAHIALHASQTPDALHVRPVAHHLSRSRRLSGDDRRGAGAATELVDQ